MQRHSKDKKIYLTQEAFDKAQAEFPKLQKLREEILVRLQTAREMGDLSENGAYKYAKFELGNVNRKLRDVNELLRYGVIIERRSDGVADLGSQVVLKNPSRTMDLMLVSDKEANPTEKKISVNSPLGLAILGKRAGEQVVFEAPAGSIEYTLEEVS